MSLFQELTAQKEAIEARLAILSQAPTDSYPVGTVVVFASGPSGNTKWHYVKLINELWKTLKPGETGQQLPLSEWILAARESPIGYFEVYVLTVAEDPIYASPG